MKRRTSGVINFRKTGNVEPFTMGDRNKPKLPSLWKRAKNFVRDAGKVVVKGVKRRTAEEVEQILDKHCRPCDRSINENTEMIQCTHPDCGCWMMWKTRLRDLHCPEGKW